LATSPSRTQNPSRRKRSRSNAPATFYTVESGNDTYWRVRAPAAALGAKVVLIPEHEAEEVLGFPNQGPLFPWSILITAFLMSIALRARRNKVVTGIQGLVGEIGIAQTALSRLGKVFVHGELWNAVSSAPLAAGQPVVVRKVDGLELQVDPSSSAQEAEASTPA